MHGPQQIVPGLFRHGARHQTALLNGQRRVLQEALLQPVHVVLLQQLVPLFGDQPDHQLFHERNGRHQHQQRGKAEQRVHQRHSDSGHHSVHEGEVENGVGAIEDHSPDGRAQHIDQQIDKGGALAADIGAQRREQHRDCRADGNTHDDGQRDLERDGTGAGKHLQNTHGGTGALQYAGKHKAHQNTQQRIGEGGQDRDELRALFQGRHRAGHSGHAIHQHREAQQDIAHIFAGGLFLHHAQQNAHDGEQARQRGGGQQIHPAAAAGEAVQAQDPAGDAGTQDRAHDDADGLTHLHHTGVDEAHHHDGGGGGRLDHRGDAGTQQDAFDGRT